MGSSLGFGSSACDYGSCDPRPIQTRFRFGFGRQALTSPHTANSPDHSSIGTPSRYRDESRQHASTAAYHAEKVWAIPVSLATTQGMISVPRGTEMFQFPRCPPRTL